MILLSQSTITLLVLLSVIGCGWMLADEDPRIGSFKRVERSWVVVCFVGVLAVAQDCPSCPKQVILPGWGLSGNVTAADGSPLPDIDVVAISGSVRIWDSTDAQGHLDLKGAKSCRYSVAVQVNEVNPPFTPPQLVDLQPGSRKSLTFRAASLRSISRQS